MGEMGGKGKGGVGLSGHATSRLASCHPHTTARSRNLRRTAARTGPDTINGAQAKPSRIAAVFGEHDAKSASRDNVPSQNL